MVKKEVAKKSAEPVNKQLVDAIITVKSLQEFIKEHGTVAAALGAVQRVQQLIQLTGGFCQLTEALEIVGQESASATPSCTEGA